MTGSATETGPGRPLQFRLSTMLIAVVFIAVIVAVPLLVRDFMAPKTRFAPGDVNIVGRTLDITLPANTRLQLGYYHHAAGDTTMVLRSVMSVTDSKLLRSSLGIAWADRPEYSTSLKGWWLESIDAADRYHKPTPRVIDFVLTNPNGTSIIFCKPTSDEVPVYFNVSDYPSPPEEIARLLWWK